MRTTQRSGPRATDGEVGGGRVGASRARAGAAVADAVASRLEEGGLVLHVSVAIAHRLVGGARRLGQVLVDLAAAVFRDPRALAEEDRGEERCDTQQDLALSERRYLNMRE